MSKSFEYMGAPPRERKPEPKRKENPKSREEEKIDQGKRNSLRIIGGAVFAMVGGGAIRKISTMGNADEETVIYPNPEIAKKKPDQEPEQKKEESDSEEEVEPDMDYAESLSDILDFDKEGPIRLTPEIMKKVREYWKARYKNDPKMRESLKYAYREMGSWQEYLKEVFVKNRVPEQMAYLAIPESHWNVKKMTSTAGAFGYYQITEKTGRRMGMKIGTIIDERMNPIKGADLCARYLKEWHDKAKGSRKEDRQEYWSLALATYNGSFAQTYINECTRERREISYGGFLKTIEDKLNKTKDDLRENELRHIVGRRESLSSIAKKYGISYKEIQRANALKGSHLKRNQSLLIPTAKLEHEAKKKVFAVAISGFSENLNYPEKFNAIYELIDERFVTEQKPKINLEPPYRIQQETGVVDLNSHTVKSGETASMISRKYGVPVKKIAKNNKSINLNKLRPGDILDLPNLKGKDKILKAKNLITEAMRNGIPVKDMGFKNQHVRDWQATLPNGTELRV